MDEKQLTCHDLLHLLSDYVEGDLPADTCQKLEEHMRSCENCRVVFNTFRKTIELVHDASSESIDLPEPIRSRLLQALGADCTNHDDKP